VQRDLVCFDAVTASPFDLAESAFELGIGKRLDLATVVADEMMVMLAVGMDWLEASAVGADLHALNVSLSGELLERAVHGRDSDLAPLAPETVENLLRGEAA
jgi:hypothetical protein